ncbi:hypothetical protein Tco_1119733 [Tanacetum coccineum]
MPTFGGLMRISPVEMDDDTLVIEDSDVSSDSQANRVSGSSSRGTAVLAKSVCLRGTVSFAVMAGLYGRDRQHVLDEDDDERYDESDFVSSDGSKL